MEGKPISRDQVLEQLERILSSGLFEGASRSRALLKFVVEAAVEGRADRLKEYTIGAEALGRGESFDPRTDPIVRAEASRLRGRLERYYAAVGQVDPVIIALPKGSYVPQLLERSAAMPVLAAPGSVVDPPRRSRGSRFVWLAYGAIGVASLLGIGMWASRRFTRPAEASLVQFDVEVTTSGSVSSEVGTDVVLSPDGSRIAFVSRGVDGVPHLSVRRLDQPLAAELPGTDGARGPFFSPEGLWVGFWASGKLKKTPVTGGSPVVLCDATDLLGASWGEDGNIIASLGRRELSRISASGGLPTTVLDLNREAITPMWPQVLPGAKLVLFTAVGFSGPNGASIEMLSLSTGKRVVMERRGTFGRYLPNGYLIYVNQGTLFSVAADVDRLEVHGAAIPVLDNVSYSSTFGFAQMDFSRTGAMVYRKSSGEQVTAQWLDSMGNIEPMIDKPGRYLWPRLSPDGSRLAVSVTESGASGVWIYEGKPDRMTRLTSVVGKYLPLWSPNGRFLILGGVGGLAWLNSDGEGKPRPLMHSTNAQVPWSFTPDGTRLAYHELSHSTGFDLWTVPIQVSEDGLTAGEPKLFLQTPAFETYPSFSPDGRWIAYGSNESGSWEVYVRVFPDDGRKFQVSRAGGRIARWSPNGHDLLYRTDDQRIMVATYDVKGASFAVRAVKPWSDRRLADTNVLANFDLSADGRRILALMPAARPEEQQTANHVTFMLNFFDEVRRRVASAGR